MINDGSIAGGGGGYSAYGSKGAHAAGGAGVYLKGGTLITAGTITGGGGGLSYNRTTGAAGDAVQFGGSNAATLVIDPGAVFNGQVAASTAVDDVLVLGGTAAGSLAGLGTQFTGFTTIDFAAGATWTVEGTQAALADGQTIAGFAQGDAIVLDGFAATGETYVAGVGVVLDQGSNRYTLGLAGNYGRGSFDVVTASGDTTITVVIPPLITTISTPTDSAVTLGNGTYATTVTITDTGSVTSDNPALNSVNLLAAGETLVNAGVITGASGVNGGISGVGLFMEAGTVTNTGTIAGGSSDLQSVSAVNINGGTLINAGTIEAGNGPGAAAMYFHGDATLVIDPGAVFDGTVQADSSDQDVLELAGTAPSTLGGLGTQFTGFTTIEFAAGATWTVEGTQAALAGGQTITGFALGDGIVLDGFAATGETYVAGVGVVLDQNSNRYTLGLAGNYGNRMFDVVTASGNTTITLDPLISTISTPTDSAVTLGNGTYTTNLTIADTGSVIPSTDGATAVTLDSAGDVLLNHGAIDGGVGSYNYRGAGGAGGAGVSLSSGTLTNSGSITGGDGGACNKGAGGIGGAGVSLSAGTLTNDGAITGGGGGYGNTDNGGVGGAGVYLSGGTLITAGTITGGGGGDSNYATLGGGGAGVYLNGGTLITAGTITGGSGSAAGDAVQFGSSNAATLVIDPGAVFNGQVAASTAVDDVLVLAGTAPSTLGGLGTQFTGFTTIDFAAGATWTVEGTQAALAGDQTIAGFALGDGIVLDGFAATGETYVAGVGVVLDQNSNSYTVGLAGNYVGLGFVVVTASGNTTITVEPRISTISTPTDSAVTLGNGTYATNLTITDTGSVTSDNPALNSVNLLVAGEILVNAGVITGASGVNGGISGVGLFMEAGTVTNTGTIAGGSSDLQSVSAVNINGGTLVNAGTIEAGNGPGAAAMYFHGDATLVIDPGAVFDGTVQAHSTDQDVLELAGTAPSTLGGLGTQFTGFTTIDFAAGASWTVEGTQAAMAGGQTITGFALGDGIVLDGFAATGETYVAGVGVVLDQDSNRYTLALAGNYGGHGFDVVTASGNTTITLEPLISTISIPTDSAVTLGNGTYATTVTITDTGSVILSTYGATAVTLDSAGEVLLNQGAIRGGGNGGRYNRDGAGGIGGAGVSLSAGTLTNEGTITGGGGGDDDHYNGGAGGAGVSLLSGTLTNEGTITGGAGGASTYGDGGAAGAGVSLSSGTLTNDVTITGGGGGYTSSGTGGAGGAGVSIASGTLTNDGTIAGGGGGYSYRANGGAGGAGVSLSFGTMINDGTAAGGGGGLTFYGSGGVGGAGIYLSGGTLITAGTITGGSGGKSVQGNRGAAGDAVQFGGSNAATLVIDPGAVFNGQVAASTAVDDVLVLGGTAAGSLAGLGTQFTGFTTIDFAAGATWTVEGTQAALADGQTIAGFAQGDAIVLDGFAATGETYVAGVGVVLDQGSNRYTLGLAGNYGRGSFDVVTASGDTTITVVIPPLITTISTPTDSAVTLGNGTYATTVTITDTGSVTSDNPALNSVNLLAAGETLVNAGVITGASGVNGGISGVGLFMEAGTVTNTGTIAGGSSDLQSVSAVNINGGTLINAGTIEAGNGPGAAAMYFHGDATLVIDPGAVFDGTVQADSSDQDVLELGVGNGSQGTLSGLGSQYTGFSTFLEDSGANWLLAGSNSFGGTATIGGTLAIAGSFDLTSGTLSAANGVSLSGSLTVASGATLSASGDGATAVTVDSAAYLLVDGGVTGGAGIYNFSVTGGDGGAGVSLAGGTLTNDGTITGGAGGNSNTGNGGVGGAGVSMSSGTLTNNGNIAGGTGGRSDHSNFGAAGAGVSLSGGTLTNDGTITGGGGGGTGAYLNGGSLINHGTIAGADNGVAGVYLNGGTLTNYGAITGAHGGNGGAGAHLSGGTLINDGTITGGSGSYNGYANYPNGGVGGAGVYLNGGTLSTAGTITGGGGGYSVFGYGGAGGAGVYLKGGTLIAAGTITGGSGGGGGGGGAGGAGVYLNGGTLIAAGTINGGSGGGSFVDSNFNGAAGDAVQFGGSNAATLVIDPGAVFNGQVAGSTHVSDVLELSGTTSATLDGIGTQFTGFATIEFAAGATWTVEGTQAALAGGQTIAGFATGDGIVLDGFAATGETYVAGVGVVLDQNSNRYTLALAGNYGNRMFDVVTASGNTTITLDPLISTISIPTDSAVTLGNGTYATTVTITDTGSVILSTYGATAVTLDSAGDVLLNQGAIRGGGNGGSYNRDGAGGIGGAGVSLSAGTLTNDATITGGGGGDDDHYNGGAGGAGVSLLSGTLTNEGTITGGGGGVSFDGDGGAGGAGVSLSAGTLTNDGAITGGNGGYSYHGNGGAAGAGVSLSAGTLTNDGTVTGGGGGYSYHGSGGAGGAGVSISFGTMINDGTAAGGVGGVSFYGSGGVGGAGVYLSGGTLITSGTITGGSGGNSFQGNRGAAGDAVQFGSSNAATLIIDPGAVFNGQVAASTHVNDVLELSGTTSATLDGIGTNFANFSTLSFDPGTEWTVEGTAAGLAAIDAITGLERGDEIVIDNFVEGGFTYADGQLVLTEASDPVTLNIEGDYTQQSFDVSTDGTNTTIDVLCFLRGTGILTPTGEIPVEDVKIGDPVFTLSRGVQPIRWIGTGKLMVAAGHRSPATPVIVRRGAIAENVPHRDLYLTKGHALYIQGAFIPAEFLVNHRSIVWDDAAREVEFYHIELPSHEVLVADGAPSESYRDEGNRWMFANANPAWTSQAWPRTPLC